MKVIRNVIGAGAALLFSAASAMAADYSLKFQTSDPSGSPSFQLMEEWAQRVNVMTADRVEIEILPIGSVVKHTETLDAVGAGILDGHLTATGYFSGKDPAFGLIGNTVGAWSDPNDMLLFIEYGGGRELYEELLEPYGVQFIGASATGLEAFVSKKPLNGVADLKGLKMRSPEGLVQAIFAAAGAAPVSLPTSEVFTALDKGVIDAADYTVFSVNQHEGMHKVAGHPVYPGFHSMPVLEVSMNKDTWDGMSGDIQEILRVSVRDFARRLVSELKLKDQVAVAEAIADPNITVHDWSSEERAKFRAIALRQWEIFAEKSDNARKVYDALQKFLTENGML